MSTTDRRTAFVTGAARGIGLAIARRLAADGCAIVATDVIAQPQASDDWLVTEADVTDQTSLDAAVAAGLQRFGRLDVVVGCAGVLDAIGPTWTIEEEAWQRVVDIDLNGAWRTTKATIPHLIDAGRGGSIVLVNSIGGMHGVGQTAAYTAAKHGVTGLLRSLVNEISAHDIRINSVHPTVVDTQMIHKTPSTPAFCPTSPTPPASSSPPSSPDTTRSTSHGSNPRTSPKPSPGWPPPPRATLPACSSLSMPACWRKHDDLEIREVAVVLRELIETSNKPFSAWGEIFGDDVVAAAMIDRLVHHAEILARKGDSYRLEDRDSCPRGPAATHARARARPHVGHPLILRARGAHRDRSRDARARRAAGALPRRRPRARRDTRTRTRPAIRGDVSRAAQLRREPPRPRLQRGRRQRRRQQRLVDDLVAWGDTERIDRKLSEHRDAGADHVCVQIVGPGYGAPPFAPPREAYRELAGTLVA